MLTDMVIIEPSWAEEKVTEVAALRWPLVAFLPAFVQCVSSKLDAFAPFFAPMRSESRVGRCGPCGNQVIVGWSQVALAKGGNRP
jgi:hypothetical protein